MTDDELLAAAHEVRERAYCPYSKFRVGAALIDDNGNVHVGCNVENAANPLGNCAEVSAIAAMIAAGGKKIVTIAVAGGEGEPRACSPCGGCRQRIAEFADSTTRIIFKTYAGEWQSFSVDEILPEYFKF